MYWFKDGISGWRRFNFPMEQSGRYDGIALSRIAPAKAKELLDSDESIFVLDVRPAEFDRWPYFIKNSFHCPLLEIETRLDEIPRDRPVLVVDWVMLQSPLVARYLISEDFNVLGVLRGGLERWSEEGLPVENWSEKQYRNP